MNGPEDFLLRFGREAIAEMALLDHEHQQKNLTGHGRDLRDWLHRIADRVAAENPDSPAVPNLQGARLPVSNGGTMSAAEDYPTLTGPDAERALNEISLLRMDVATLLNKLRVAETKLRIVGDPNASVWRPDRYPSATDEP